MKTKIRNLPKQSSNWATYSYQFPAVIGSATGSCVFVGLQRTLSDGHPWPPKKGDKRDLGGSFLMQKVEIDPGGTPVSTRAKTIDHGDPKSGQAAWSCQGTIYPFYAGFTARTTDFLAPSSPGQLDAIGTKLISMAIPTNPNVNLGQFLGELIKDGLPTVPNILKWQAKAQSFSALAKHGSKEYLNVQFGWAPFIRDVVDAVKMALDYSKKLRQFARDSGKPIKRRRSLPITQTITTSGPFTSYGAPAFPLYNYLSSGKYVQTVTTSTEHWFSGAFTYYLPLERTLEEKLRRWEAQANKLIGSRLTVDLLYKLTPWTWLVDWFTTMGALVHNYSAFRNDGLVMLYGYVMERKLQVIQYSLSGVVLSDGTAVSNSQSIIKTTLSRRKATPYGFGLDPQSFSAFQWSIIAALGISKAPRSLAF